MSKLTADIRTLVSVMAKTIRRLGELSTLTITESNTETRFNARANRGSVAHGLDVLDAMDKREQEAT